MYDIGMVYKKEERYYLSVGAEKLLTFVEREPGICQEQQDLQKVHGMSVGKLCVEWNIPIDLLDRVVDKHLLQKEEALCVASSSGFLTAT